MKRDTRKAMVFVLTAALTLLCFIPRAGAEALAAQAPGAASADAEAPAPALKEAASAYTASAPETPEGVSLTQKTLKDIQGHWGEKEIQKALDYGFVQGYEDGSFRPDKPVLRAEFITMVNKALKLRGENTLELLYSDVKESDWFYQEIRKASYARYVNGTDQTTFMPLKEISRQEAAVMLARILPDAAAVDDTVLDGYQDADQISSWAKPGMALVVGKGYLNGYGPGRLGPKAALSRAEAAKIIGLILDRETIVREDVSIKSANETLEGKIYVGDITIEKSVGEGDATLKNIVALSGVYVLGGGAGTITVSNSTIIQLVVCKEGTAVRVLSDGETSIYQTFVFNGGILAESGGQTAEAGTGSYFSVIRLNGNVSAETAAGIADAIAERLDSSGQITLDQLKAALSAILEGFEISTDSSGNFVVNLPKNIQLMKSSSGSNRVYTTVNGRPATISFIENGCSCGLPWSNRGTFTKTITFYPSGDAGSPLTAYVIETEAQLQHLALHPDSNAFLMNDLDFSQYGTGSGDPSAPMGILKTASQAGLYTEGYDINHFEYGKFVPIGTDSHPYSGTFCGNGKTITGLEIYGWADYVGLFGYTSGAAISGLTVKGGSISGVYCVGALVGEARGGTLENCGSSAAVSGSGDVGGLVGSNDEGSVLNSGNTGSVSGEYSVGGVVGSNYGDILNSGNTGAISGSEAVGGIAGQHMEDTAVIENCYNTGSVSGESDIGGVTGEAYWDAAVKNSCNTGAVAGNERVGGVAGSSNYHTALINCYTTGVYSGDNYVGSVTGDGYESSVTNCRWLEGTAASGIGASSAGSAAAFSHSDPNLSEVYSRIAAISSGSGIASTGAISSIDFGAGGRTPSAFHPLQGSYIVSAPALAITVGAITGTSITVESGPSVSDIISSGGITIDPTVPGGNAYDLSGLSPGSWVLIKAENTDPAETRSYTMLIQQDVETVTVGGNPAILSDIEEDCSCGLPLSSPGAFTKEALFYPGNESDSTVKGFAIYTEAQLQHLALHPDSNAFLMNDLDFSRYETGSGDPSTPMGALKLARQAGFYTGRDIGDFETGNFVPIGYAESEYDVRNAYTGVFCGNGKIISGLAIYVPEIDYLGLFGYTYGADISGVAISGGSVTVGGYGSYVAAIAGKTYGGAIRSCSSSAEISGFGHVGGLVGENYNECTISDSRNTGRVAGAHSVGGLAGLNYCAHIENSYNTGAVSGISEVGGVAGRNYYSTIENSVNTGTVSGQLETGGIAGVNDEQTTIENSVNTGAVSGDNQIGGVAGVNGSAFGYGSDAVIRACYNTGAVSGSSRIGGISGTNIDRGIITDSYNTGAVSGDTDTGSAVGDYSGGSVEDCRWLEGTNQAGTGTGSGSGIAASPFGQSDPALASVYSWVEEIAEDAGSDPAGAMTGIYFIADDMIPAAFHLLQGSYITSGAGLTITTSALSGTTVTVTSGATLLQAMSSGGTAVAPTSPGGDEYDLTGLSPGAWVLIKAENALLPEKTRYYTIFRNN